MAVSSWNYESLIDERDYHDRQQFDSSGIRDSCMDLAKKDVVKTIYIRDRRTASIRWWMQEETLPR